MKRTTLLLVIIGILGAAVIYLSYEIHLRNEAIRILQDGDEDGIVRMSNTIEADSNLIETDNDEQELYGEEEQQEKGQEDNQQEQKDQLGEEQQGGDQEIEDHDEDHAYDGPEGGDEDGDGLEIIPEDQIAGDMADGSDEEPEIEESTLNLNTNDLEDIPTSASPDASYQDAQMLVYCPRSMTEKQEYNIKACIAPILEEAGIMEAISQAESVDMEVVEASSSTYEVTISERYQMTITFDPEDFELISDKRSYEAKLSNRPQWFDWVVKPILPGNNKKITFALKNWVDDEWVSYKPPQVYKIDVDVNTSNFFSNLWIFARDNPEWSWTSIIIPIVTYFFGWWRRRKKEKKEAAAKTAAT